MGCWMSTSRATKPMDPHASFRSRILWIVSGRPWRKHVVESSIDGYRRFGRCPWNSKVYVIKKCRHWRVFRKYIYRFFYCVNHKNLYMLADSSGMKQASNQTVFLIDQIPGATFGNGAVDAVAVFFLPFSRQIQNDGRAVNSKKNRTERAWKGVKM